METLDGLAIAFDSLSEIITEGGKSFRELIPADCVIRYADEVRLIVKHDEGMPLASTRDQSLTLTRTDKGIEYTANINTDNEYARDFMTLYKKHKRGKMSFGFTAVRDEWSGDVRTLREIVVSEISIVSQPAYPATTCGLTTSLKEKELALLSL